MNPAKWAPNAKYVCMRDLTHGVRMIREAVEQTFGAGLLPPAEYAGANPVEECEAIKQH